MKPLKIDQSLDSTVRDALITGLKGAGAGVVLGSALPVAAATGGYFGANGSRSVAATGLYLGVALIEAVHYYMPKPTTLLGGLVPDALAPAVDFAAYGFLAGVGLFAINKVKSAEQVVNTPRASK